MNRKSPQPHASFLMKRMLPSVMSASLPRESHDSPPLKIKLKVYWHLPPHKKNIQDLCISASPHLNSLPQLKWLITIAPSIGKCNMGVHVCGVGWGGGAEGWKIQLHKDLYLCQSINLLLHTIITMFDIIFNRVNTHTIISYLTTTYKLN